MARQQPIELFMPPNMLKAKVGGTIGGIDMAAIKRAEAAVEELKGEFQAWIGDDVDSLRAARDAFAKEPSQASRALLFRACHDIRGQAATFEFPMIARIAASLCKLIDALPAPEDIPLALVDAHVTAVRVVFRDKIKDMGNRMASELCEELEARVADLLDKAPKAA